MSFVGQKMGLKKINWIVTLEKCVGSIALNVQDCIVSSAVITDRIWFGSAQLLHSPPHFIF